MGINRSLYAGAALALLIAGSLPALGQSQPTPPPTISQEQLRAARELADVFNAKMIADMISSLTSQVWPAMEATLRADNPKIDAATIAELRKEFERLMAESQAELMKDAPGIYAKYFTAGEMRDLVVFYHTPLGQKALAVMPKAMADLTSQTLPRMQGLQERIYLAFLNILEKRGLYGR